MASDAAFLQVALLAARADGKLQPEELRAIAQRMGHPATEAALREAAAWLDQTDPEDLFDALPREFPTRAERMQALALACKVADADGMLAWSETGVLTRMAQAFEMDPRDVRRVLAGR
ncbi:MAG: Tellurite resistance protein TerB [Thermoplasmata archaeon]|jgi:tellurite resistance protein|nr:Tellurite resistance protein TerB [Thermoplasmata archaeon]